MEPDAGSSPYSGLLTTARYPCQAARANRKALAKNVKRGEHLTDANRYLIVSRPMLNPGLLNSLFPRFRRTVAHGSR